MQGRILPRPRAARARHGARPRSEGKVSERLIIPRGDPEPDKELTAVPDRLHIHDAGMYVALNKVVKIRSSENKHEIARLRPRVVHRRAAHRGARTGRARS